MTVTIKKVGGSLAVIIPSAVAKESKLIEGTVLDLSSTPDSITMQKQGRRPRRSIAKIASLIKPASYSRRNAEIADSAVGKEIW